MDNNVEGINRPPVENMTDREIAEETLMWLRFAGQALTEIQSKGIGGMMRMMLTNGK